MKDQMSQSLFRQQLGFAQDISTTVARPPQTFPQTDGHAGLLARFSTHITQDNTSGDEQNTEKNTKNMNQITILLNFIHGSWNNEINSYTWLHSIKKAHHIHYCTHIRTGNKKGGQNLARILFFN